MLDIAAIIKNSTSISSTQLAITATNEYGKFSAPYPWLDSVEGSQIVEPYKLTKLSLSGPLFDEAKYVYAWYITGATNVTGEAFVEEWNVWVGSSVDVYFERTGKFQLAVVLVSNDGEDLGAFVTLAIIKYDKYMKSIAN